MASREKVKSESLEDATTKVYRGQRGTLHHSNHFAVVTFEAKLVLWMPPESLIIFHEYRKMIHRVDTLELSFNTMGIFHLEFAFCDFSLVLLRAISIISFDMCLHAQMLSSNLNEEQLISVH